MSATKEAKKAAKGAVSMLKRPAFWIAVSVVSVVAVSIASMPRVRQFFSAGVSRVKGFVMGIFGGR